MNDEQLEKVTVWAVTARGFTVAGLAEQIKRARVAAEHYQEFVDMAKVQIREWKARGKVKFDRGQWKWVVN